MFGDSKTITSCRHLKLEHRALHVVEAGENLGLLAICGSRPSCNLPAQCIVACHSTVPTQVQDKLQMLR